MRSSTLAIVAVGALVACSRGSQTADTANQAEAMGFTGARWSATLTAPPGSPAPKASGTAMVLGNAEGSQTRVEVLLNDGTAGATLPWHLHRGTCGNDQGIVGEASAYQPLVVGADGRATGSATIPMPMPRSGEYMINVHASSSDMGTIVACGNLAGPSE
jgi:Cu-Zn family superoxide dismutase